MPLAPISRGLVARPVIGAGGSRSTLANRSSLTMCSGCGEVGEVVRRVGAPELMPSSVMGGCSAGRPARNASSDSVSSRGWSASATASRAYGSRLFGSVNTASRAATVEMLVGGTAGGVGGGVAGEGGGGAFGSDKHSNGAVSATHIGPVTR